jgi:abortive infection bacteriophage resistance protein
MPRSYNGNISTTEDYLIYLYTNGFHKSNYIGDDKVIKICNNVGVFKLKGYVKEIKHLAVKNIDDVLVIYLFDKFLSKIFFDITSRIEAKLKSILINEAYSHYILFYLQNYAFNDNRRRYLAGSTLLSTVDIVKYNYPPFKYLIESATLGSVNAFIKSLKIGTTDINKQVSRHFGVGRNTTIFNHYLDRLNEIRNRTAHGGRIYNRTFRSVTGVGKYQIFRMGIDNH